ncbi:hypothetical protein ACA085_17215 [Xanthomonas fragariae]
MSADQVAIDYKADGFEWVLLVPHLAHYRSVDCRDGIARRALRTSAMAQEREWMAANVPSRHSVHRQCRILRVCHRVISHARKIPFRMPDSPG